MKTNKMCPICFIKRAFVHTGKMPDNIAVPPIDNAAACPTPPMGWSSWNCFRGNIDEGKITEIAHAMKACGLLDAGYRYVNLDDCWQSSLRNENGAMQGDLTTFPSGIKHLFDNLKKEGFSCGIYSSNGTATCEDLPASEGTEKADAEAFVEMGADYLKYDFCHNVKIPYVAPLLTSVVLTDPKSGESFDFPIKTAKKYGFAKIRKDVKGTEYVSGIDRGAGAIEFYTNLKPGEYVLSLTFKKHGYYKKYLGILAAGRYYETEIAETHGWSALGKAQVQITLSDKNGSLGNNIILFNPISDKKASARILYRRMAEEFIRAAEKKGRSVVFSICEWGRNKPYLWGADTGNLWRTTLDIRPIWKWINVIYRHTLKLSKYAKAGAYNDPDMLEVGNGKLSEAQNKTHFTLWCMMSSPLILGNDVRKFLKKDGTPDSDNPTLKIVTNRALIAINQDPFALPCKLAERRNGFDVLVKPLADGKAIAVYNTRKKARSVTVDLDKLLGKTEGGRTLTNLWTGETVKADGTLRLTVEGFGVEVFRV